jgi:hypothetical protein
MSLDEQWIETATGVEGVQVVATADMDLADKNLRNCATTAASHHFGAT